MVMDLSKVKFPCYVLDVTSFSCEDMFTPQRLSGLIFDSIFTACNVVESNLHNDTFSIEIHKATNLHSLKYHLKSALGDDFDNVEGSDDE